FHGPIPAESTHHFKLIQLKDKEPRKPSGWRRSSASPGWQAERLPDQFRRTTRRSSLQSISQESQMLKKTSNGQRSTPKAFASRRPTVNISQPSLLVTL